MPKNFIYGALAYSSAIYKFQTGFTGLTGLDQKLSCKSCYPVESAPPPVIFYENKCLFCLKLENKEFIDFATGSVCFKISISPIIN